MPDDAVAREAAEADSLFAHPPVPPEATLRYGEHPDQLVDFYAPRGPEHPGGHPLVLVLHGGAWRATYDRAHLTPFAGLLARRGFAVALAEYRRGAGLPGQGAKARTRALAGDLRRHRDGAGHAARTRPQGAPAGRPRAHGAVRALLGRAPRAVGRGT
ncbi:hypothetical protein GA0115246_109587, partial [Streptomyces sp. SolWspMP-sol7th]